MTGKFAIRATVLAVLFCMTLPAANIIKLANYTPSLVLSQGDWSPAASVYTTDASGTLQTYNPVPWVSTMITVGGVLEPIAGPPPSSAAVSATGLAVTNVAQFVTNGNACGSGLTLACTEPLFETALGILTADLNNLLGDSTIGVTNASAIAWSIPMAGNETLELDYNFVANDTDQFNDFGFFIAKTATAQYVQMLGSVLQSGDFTDTGWKYFSFNFTRNETYTVAFGVANVGHYTYNVGTSPTATMFNFDSADGGYYPDPQYMDSALLLADVPEPGTWLLAGTALLFVSLSRLRKRR